ncbi:tumor necrosis factor receptor superfamily member 25 isoform X3 [Apodemus sylvaticus]|uniref:tumor necrosis factor receptor superfamily member 25 isoform X3 n=1 Tax=Apodemus sylvaticus TaxID=10129 RepID=UPI002242FCFE|nr:tumor necrosis factor receptor superfamily member 25 isoform X3 [Apodemus sylvaticus]
MPRREGSPPGAATPGSAARVLQPLFLPLLLLLLLPGGRGQGQGQGQGGTPGRCDCASESQKRYGPFCCRGCPKGHYMKAPCTEPCGDSVCLPCPQGTFLTRDGHFKTECTRCQVCDEEALQVTLENCSAEADTHCGCQSGWCADCSTEPCGKSSPFSCVPCSGYEATTPRPCPPGFYRHGNGCSTCPTSFSSPCPKACTAVCGWKQMFWVQVLLGALFLLGAILICAYWRWQPCKPVVTADTAGTETLASPQTTRLSASDSAHTLLAPASSTGKVCTTIQLVGNNWTPALSQTQEVVSGQASQPWDQLPNRSLGPPLASPLSPAPPAGSPAAVLQPGPQLYDVMDAVPARRWKEFVRTLGLREAEIEAVEVEICRFRDQQYEMLKRWRQQQPAGLGAIYAALERMGLEGCAEDLRSRLQRGP